MRHRILLAAAFAYLAIANVIWIARDTRPPFWDMAAHQTAALRIHDAVESAGPAGLTQIESLTLPYPPFYHSIVAVFYAMFGRSTDTAQYANIPAILLLLLATYGIGRTILSPLSAASAAVLVSFYPLLLWLSRETIIDYWLTGMVAASVWVLLRTKEFSDLRWSIAFGVVAGLGMLTKWTFPFFLALPFLWCSRNHWKKAALAGSIAAGVAAVWYLPAAPAMAQLLRINSGQALSEGDPGRISLQAIAFYVRALEGYQLFLPLFSAFVIGAILLAGRFEKRWMPIVLWVAGGWAGLLLFQNKDPRYSAPILPAIAIVTAILIEKRRWLLVPLMALLLFQHYLVSFGLRQLPQTAMIARGVGGPLPWNWNIYTQQYFGLWGPPADEDWRIEYVLKKISRTGGPPVRIGMIPDIPRFDSFAFQFYATLGHFPVTVIRLISPDEEAISNTDYILLSETDQGPVYAATPGPGIKDYILGRPDRFEILEWFALPNGNVIRLYRVGHS